MTKRLLAVLLALAALDAGACPLCLGAYQASAAQQLTGLQRSVLAVRQQDGSGYRVVEPIKGERPPGGRIDPSAVQLKVAPSGKSTTLLLVSDGAWPMWVSSGAIGAEHARWLREIATGKRALEMSSAEWQARVALMLPHLESAEPLVAEIAYGELAGAPYAALLASKSRIDAAAVRRWLANPNLAARRSLYLLLLGIAGNARDADNLETELDAARKGGDATNVGSMIAADLQLRGPARVEWIDEHYLRDRVRSSAEIEAALLALSVHGNANGTIPRERVIRAYRTFIGEHKDIAGLVAQDLAAWEYWDAVPEYVSLMSSGVRQQYPSRIAIVAYLRQSPAGRAGGIDLPPGDGPLPEAARDATRTTGLPAVIPQ